MKPHISDFISLDVNPVLSEMTLIVLLALLELSVTFNAINNGIVLGSLDGIVGEPLCSNSVAIRTRLEKNLLGDCLPLSVLCKTGENMPMLRE